MANHSELEIIQHTKNWLEQVVIALGFCPFAKREVLQDSIRYVVYKNVELEQVLLGLVEELKYLDSNAEVETSLLIYPDSFADFEDYLDLVAMGQDILRQLDYEGIYQLASFHPQYQFAGTTINEASNYTNRSPYPILHLLREESLEKALEYHDDPESIPEKNIQVAEELGLKTLHKMLLNCYKT